MKKIYIIIGIGLLIGGTLIALIFFKKPQTTEKPKQGTSLNGKIDQTKLEKLLKDNYRYASYALAALNNSEESSSLSFFEIEEAHYLINDADIKSLADLNDLVFKVFIPEKHHEYYTLLHDNKDFMQFDDDLYGYSKKDSCAILENVSFNAYEVKTITDDNFTILFYGGKYQVHIIDDEYLLAENVFKCQQS